LNEYAILPPKSRYGRAPRTRTLRARWPGKRGGGQVPFGTKPPGATDSVPPKWLLAGQGEFHPAARSDVSERHSTPITLHQTIADHDFDECCSKIIGAILVRWIDDLHK
jgi:hypothetical protein